MMRRIGWLAAVLSFSAVAGTPVAFTPAQQQAIMDSGTQFGQGALSVGAGTINGAGGAVGVPSYNTTPSGQSPGGTGLFGSATAKQAECNGYTAPAGAGQVPNQQDCDAVDYLAKHPTTERIDPATGQVIPSTRRFPIDPKTDPTILAGTAVLMAARNGTAFDPGGVAAGYGAGATTTQTGCQTTTATTPAPTMTQTCYQFMGTQDHTCDEILNVVNQCNTTYQCTESNITTTTCDKTLNTSVVLNGVCTISGTFVGLAPSGTFDVSFTCVDTTMASVTVSINPSHQCHANGCNSDYFSMTLNFLTIANATATSNLARDYTGAWWHNTTVSYDAVTKLILISMKKPYDVINSLYISTDNLTNSVTNYFPVDTTLFSYAYTDNSDPNLCTNPDNGPSVCPKISVDLYAAAPSCPVGTSSVPYTYKPNTSCPDPNGGWMACPNITVGLCAAAPTCPDGTSPAPSCLGGTSPVTSCPVGTRPLSYTYKPNTSCPDPNGGWMACPNITVNVCIASYHVAGGISVQPVVTSSWADACTALQAKTY